MSGSTAQQVAGSRRAGDGAGQQPFDVVDPTEFIADAATKIRAFEELLDGVLPLPDAFGVQKRCEQPAMQEPAAEKASRGDVLFETSNRDK